MAKENIAITSHAVERFVKRHAPEMSFREAKQFLQAEAPKARRVKERTLKGDIQWELGDPYCILVMKKDYETRAWVCVTVLPEVQGRAIPEEEMEIIREHILEKAAREAKSESEIPEDTLKEEEWEKIDKVMSAPEESKPDILTPCKDSALEEERLRQQVVVWNKIAQVRAKHLKKTRNMEFSAQADKALVVSLKHLILALKGTDREHLLEFVREQDPALLSDGFLTPNALTKEERRASQEKARKEAGILC